MRKRVTQLIEAGVMQIIAVTDPLQLGFARQAMIGVIVEGAAEAGGRDARGDRGGRLRRDHRRWLRHPRRGRRRQSDAHLLELVTSRIRPIPGVVSIHTFLYLELQKQTYTWGVHDAR